VKSAGEERAAVVHQLRLRKLAMMRKSAKSATDSLEAAALDDIRDEWDETKVFCITCCSTQSLAKIRVSAVLRF
jgi:hypothetical protein